MSARQLSQRERAVLDFERDWLAHVDGKRNAIRREFGISSSRYYQLLRGLVDVEAAEVHDPLLVRRLRRRRADRLASAGDPQLSLRNPRSTGRDPRSTDPATPARRTRSDGG